MATVDCGFGLRLLLGLDLVVCGLVWLSSSVGLVCGCCWVLILDIGVVVRGLAGQILGVSLVCGCFCV